MQIQYGSPGATEHAREMKQNRTEVARRQDDFLTWLTRLFTGLC